MVDFTGITNQNEFYFDHYLTTLMEEDLKELFLKWNTADDAARTPPELLKSVAGRWFRFTQRLSSAKEAKDRLAIQREMGTDLLEALGFSYNAATVTLKEGAAFPLVCAVGRADTTPGIWIIESFSEKKNYEGNPLSTTLSELQQPDIHKTIKNLNYEELLSKQIFCLDAPPRWVILYDHSELILAERGKWAEKRVLRFDLTEIFNRREKSTLAAMAALLHRESLFPNEGSPLFDTLNEKSHHHAFGVSESLKYSLRECIELLGNEAVRYLREKKKDGIYGRDMEEKLTRECLRYMYRLLFMFYIEARPELGYVPKPSKVLSRDPYWSAYSLETLRELEILPLVTEESRNGTFIGDSIALLFEMVYEGFKETAVKQTDAFTAAQASFTDAFKIEPLKSHLFDPLRTPTLNGVKFRNDVMQRIIRMMSLSSSGTGRKKRRGRISYAQLGINQLGAVYEALLSYSGFFAEEDLYEVRRLGKSKDDADPESEDEEEAASDEKSTEKSPTHASNDLDTGYFVKKEDLNRYSDDEKIRDKDGRALCHFKGTFIYRLAGRDRQKSASYYTPEVLTVCLVKYALKELLVNKSADEILHLTVCEMATGSAAFLNEAINQLAEAYLQKKQKETGREIPLEEYAQIKQKVKMYIADNNVFGVDLNPVAIELAEVSLWLNTIFHEEGKRPFVPWFGMQLECGNSLIGCRRLVYPTTRLLKGATNPFSDGRGDRIRLGTPLPKNAVWHFLLPNSGMADYTDKVIKSMEPEAIKKITNWRRTFCALFEDWQLDQLVNLSTRANELWERFAVDEAKMRKRTTDPLTVWGQPEAEGRETDLTEKDRICDAEMHSHRVQASSPYRRLKLVMDYWCSLWFWPIDKADLLPTREQFLFECHALLVGGLPQDKNKSEGEEISLFPETLPVQIALDLVNDIGFVNVDDVLSKSERLQLVDELAKRYRFLHWELEFADLFLNKQGFDLIVGNPPWIKVEWQEAGVMGDADPYFIVKKHSASELAKLRAEAFERVPGLRTSYLREYEEAAGTKNFLNSVGNYPELKGVQTNLYKCFLPMSWYLGSAQGIQSFLHPDGIYDAPNGGILREDVYQRLRYHFQFVNVKKLFAEILHWVTYSINVYSSKRGEIAFDMIGNLFVPQTIDKCYEHEGHGPVEGIKDDNNKWGIKGHRDRILKVTSHELILFAKLYDGNVNNGNQARLPILHSNHYISVLKKFAEYPQSLADLTGEYYCSEMWHETNAQRDGTIKRLTGYPESPQDWILSGPHFFVANPFYKTPNSVCNKHHDYTGLDLTTLPDNYLPRSNYVPAVDHNMYKTRTPEVPWKELGKSEGKRVTEFYRFVNREMLSQSGERTFLSTIIPPGPAHINTCFGTTFKNTHDLLNLFASSVTIVCDYRVKSTGMGHANKTLVEQLPLLADDIHFDQMIARALSILCLTTHYAELWQESFNPSFLSDTFLKSDPRLPSSHFSSLTPHWIRNVALRTDYSRRQALVELDCHSE